MASSWTFQGSTYELHKTPKSFNQAAQAAAAADSYLVEINSEEENRAVFTQISTLISTSEFSSTASQDGGGAAAWRRAVPACVLLALCRDATQSTPRSCG